MSEQLARPNKGKLILDLETLTKINIALAEIFVVSESQPLESFHGMLELEIVKGQFQISRVSKSFKLSENRARNKTA